MANGRRPTLAKQRARETQAKYWQHVTALLSQRDQLIDEILVRSRAGTPSPFIKKAGALLTRFWARADWQSREEILRTARWLMNVGDHAPAEIGDPRVKKTDRGRTTARVERGRRNKPTDPHSRREIEADVG